MVTVCLFTGRRLTGRLPHRMLGTNTEAIMNPDPAQLDELARRLAAAVPGAVGALRDDLQRNFRSLLQGGLARLDLVTRQEFDVQAAVLRRTREKLEALEQRLAALE